MLIAVFVLLAGLLALVWSADKFVEGSAAAGRHIGIPDLVIGLTIVSVGTSAPEIFVAVIDTLSGEPLLAIGNAIGSNICNIGLVLAVAAIVVPLPFAEPILKRELPWVLGISFLAALLLWDMHLGVVDGLILLAVLVILLGGLARSAMRSKHMPAALKGEIEGLPKMPLVKAVFWTVGGCGFLLFSAAVVVRSAEHLALELNVAEEVVGLTIVAVGTSLPELAATLRAAMKGHSGIAIGNILGSNILNIVAVLTVPALLNPTELDPFFVIVDFGAMLWFTVFLALFAYGVASRPEINRPKGIALLAAYVGFYLILALTA